MYNTSVGAPVFEPPGASKLTASAAMLPLSNMALVAKCSKPDSGNKPNEIIGFKFVK